MRTYDSSCLIVDSCFITRYCASLSTYPKEGLVIIITHYLLLITNYSFFLSCLLINNVLFQTVVYLVGDGLEPFVGNVATDSDMVGEVLEP